MAVEHVDKRKLSKLRLRISMDDPVYSGWKKLKVRGKDLAAIPKEIYFLSELEVLDMSPEREACLRYKTTDISSYIGRLVNLKVLMLDTNELVEIPDEVCLLSNLERLSLSNNHLSELPENFGRLTKLQSLHMSNNEFTVLPRGICELENLVFLDLSNNYITSLPEQIKKLLSMESLLMCNNKLTSLPDEICFLGNLRTLWIGDNQISSLPKNIIMLENLDWGQFHTSSSALDGNPLTVPPLVVCKNGIDAIETFFETYQEDNSNETKNSKSSSAQK